MKKGAKLLYTNRIGQVDGEVGAGKLTLNRIAMVAQKSGDPKVPAGGCRGRQAQA
jgi:type II secretory pathway predicted ATPase ExeA